QVPPVSRARFCELLPFAIVEARLANEIVHPDEPPMRASDIAHCLKGVASAARALDRALGGFWGEGGTFGRRNAAPTAGDLLETALKNAARDEEGTTKIGYLPRLTACRHGLAALIAAVAEAETSAHDSYPTRRGRPTGAGGNRFFDNFVRRLHETAHMTGGKWTHYRDPISPGIIEWRGTLCPAIEILRPYLPARRFF